MIAPLDALASAVELARRNTESRLYMLPLGAPDDVRKPLEAEKRVYENALALARGETPAACPGPCSLSYGEGTRADPDRCVTCGALFERDADTPFQAGTVTLR